MQSVAITASETNDHSLTAHFRFTSGLLFGKIGPSITSRVGSVRMMSLPS